MDIGNEEEYGQFFKYSHVSVTYNWSLKLGRAEPGAGACLLLVLKLPQDTRLGWVLSTGNLQCPCAMLKLLNISCAPSSLLKIFHQQPTSTISSLQMQRKRILPSLQNTLAATKRHIELLLFVLTFNPLLHFQLSLSERKVLQTSVLIIKPMTGFLNITHLLYHLRKNSCNAKGMIVP